MVDINLEFLKGKQPWRKTYILRNGETEEQPIPFSYRFTSFRETAKDLPSLYSLLQRNAEGGHALLRGHLKTSLDNAPRAGKLDRTITRTPWLLLDVDGLNCAGTAEEVLFELLNLPPVQFIEHLSSSTGFKGGYRAHIFILLEKALPFSLLRDWCWATQIANPALAESMILDPSGSVLLPVIDPASNLPGQLFAIADPTIVPESKNPAPERWRMSTRGAKFLPVSKIVVPSAGALHAHRISLLKVKRAEAGIVPQRKISGTMALAEDTYGVVWTRVESPAPALVTEVKRQGKFVRLNINGGDSEAYWHPLDKPETIYCYKGMVCYDTKKFLPEYWDDKVREGMQSASEKAEEDVTRYEAGEVIPMVALDSDTERFLCVVIKPDTVWSDVAEFGKMTSVKSWLETHGLSKPFSESPPVYKAVFDVDGPFFDPRAHTLNRFSAPPMADAPAFHPRFQTLLSHVLADDEEMVETFLDWAAFLYQRRVAPHSAWLFHGIPGTGKDLLVNFLKKVLGPEYCRSVMPHSLIENFTGWAEGTNLVYVNEIEAKVFRKNNLGSRLNDFITGEKIMVRKMRTDGYETVNRAGFIFAANRPDAVELPPGDRRLHVPPRQENNLLTVVSSTECARLASPSQDEIMGMRTFLATRNYDEARARRPLNTLAKANLAAASQSSAVRLSTDIRTGHLIRIAEDLEEYETAVDSLGIRHVIPANDLLVRILESMQDKLAEGKCSTYTAKISELRSLYAIICDPTLARVGPSKFKQFLLHSSFPEADTAQPRKHRDKSVRGIRMEITPRMEKEWMRAARILKDKGYMVEDSDKMKPYMTVAK